MAFPAAVFAAVAFLTATPGVGPNETYRGSTAQGRPVTLHTDLSDFPLVVRIPWKAPCTQGTYRETTVFRPPYDRSTHRALDDGSTDVTHDARYEYRVALSIHARCSLAHGSDLATDRWRGSVAGKVVLRRHGRPVTTCRLAPLRWSAKLSR